MTVSYTRVADEAATGDGKRQPKWPKKAKRAVRQVGRVVWKEFRNTARVWNADTYREPSNGMALNGPPTFIPPYC